MKNDRVFRVAIAGGLALVLVLLVVLIVQVNALEERFATQGQQLRALGEATDRLTAGGQRVTLGSKPTTSGEEIPPGVKLLHPDAENFVKPKEPHWPPPGAATNGVLARGWEYGDPKSFNILLDSSGVLFDQLDEYCGVKLAARNKWTNPDDYHGELAWRIEITNDVKEFTAYLRPGFRWHRPSGVNLDDPKYAWLKGDHEVTAHDLAFTLDLILNPQVQSGHWKTMYEDLESWKALDDHTFVMRWKKKQFTNLAASVELAPTPRFLYGFDQSGKPFPKESLGTSFNQHWYNNKGYVGAGPYRMASYEPGTKITLERNEAFPLEKPAIQKLVYPIYNDLKQTLLKLRAHELGVGELQAGQYREEILGPEKKGQKPKDSPFFDGRIRCEKIFRPVYSYIGWNMARPMFADKRVRRAMTHAFDRQRIIDNVWAGLGVVTTSPYLPGSPSIDPDIKPIAYDLAEAKKLLGEAGWKDTDGDGLLDKELHAGDGKRSPFEFHFAFVAGQKESESTAKILADDLLKVGVKMIIEPMEWSLLMKRRDERQFDAVFMSWLLPWYTDLYAMWHSSQVDIPKGSNAGGFRNAKADAIIEKLRVSFDPEERIRLFREFHRIVDDEQPYSFFMVRKKVYCGWNDVQNFIFAKDYPIENSLPWWVGSSAP